MKKIILLIILILVLIFLYSQVDFQLSKSSKHTQNKPSAELVRGVNPTTKSMENGYDIEESTEIEYLKSDLSTKFDKSDDLYALALELYNLAKRGDSEAQFYLAYAISSCHSPEMQSSEFDSALSLELNDWIRTRCAGFINQDIAHLGKAESWIKLSSQSKYPQALIANLIIQKQSLLTSTALNDIQLALSGRNSKVMNLIGGLGHPQKNKIANEAWKFLACDYGHDCTAQSKDIWRFHLGSICSINMMTGEECKTNIGYIAYSKSRYTAEEFEQIMNKAAFLKNIIESDKINELTFEQILE